jgi:small subunit ribosomal protein S16
MAVKIRMTRMGRRHRPFFRINAVESRTPRDGRILEKLGHYDPLLKNSDEQLVLNDERVKYWLEKGAIPTDSIIDFLKKRGITCKYMEDKAARRDKARLIARKKGVPFTKADRIAAEKAAAAAAEAKAAAEKAAEEAAAAEAAKKAEAEAAAAAEAEANAAE